MNEISKVIEVAEERFNQIAPRELNYPAEKGFSIQALKGSKYLMDAALKHPESLQQAITNVAAIGLSLSPAEHLAYLVPRGGKVCLDVSYQGMCRIATNSGSIQWIQSELVYKADTFRHNGMGSMPEHAFDAFASKQERGEFMGCYVVAKTKEGDYLTTLMSAEEVYEIKNRSAAGNKGPWKDFFGEMAKKSCVRRAFKMLPKTDEHALKRMAAAVQLSNEAEGFEPLVSSPDLAGYTEEQKKFFDQLITNGDSLGMHVLQQTIGSGEMTNLYNSFEKGTITKYKRIVDDMLSKGFSQFTDYVNLVSEAFSNGDDMGIDQIRAEISDDAWELIESKAK